MALRAALTRWQACTGSLQHLRAFSAPTVYDKLLQVIVMDGQGRRHTLKAMEGQTLIDLLVEHRDELGIEESIVLSPNGIDQKDAHVKLPNEFLTKVPPPRNEDDVRMFGMFADKIGRNSRPASTVTLTKDMNNMLVAVGEVYPSRTL